MASEAGPQLRSLLLFTYALLLLLLSQEARGALIVAPMRYGVLSTSSNMTSLRGRDLRAEARMELYGHVLTRGYYFTDLWVGTPPQHFSLIVDTGSTVTYVPCSTCTECGKHDDSPFLPSASSTYSPISCQSERCSHQQCDNQERCTYERHYAENSSSSGVLAEDIISFGKASTIDITRATFGCETRETGDLFTQKADGILALGRGPLSIVDQLVHQGVADNCFSLCYGGMERGGGTMILGAAELPPDVNFTYFDPDRIGNSAYYNLVVEELRVAGNALNLPEYAFDQGYGAVLDSGTTFTYLPKAVFAAFKSAVIAGLKDLEQVDGPDPKYNDVCFAGASKNVRELGKNFPTVEFVFGGGIVYRLDPENYLFRHRFSDGAYCLGFFENLDAGTLLGGILVRNTLVTYDRANEQVGFWKTDCESLFETLPGLSGAGTGPPDNSLEPPPDQSSVKNRDSSSDSDPATKDENSDSDPVSEDAVVENKECPGCASNILVSMTLGIDYATFPELMEEFLTDMSRELNIPQSQVEMANYGKNDVTPEGVDVEVKIVPRKPAIFISGSDAKKFKAFLMSRQLGLRDTFGSYNVTSVEIVPLGRKRSEIEIGVWVWAIAGIVGLLVIISAIAGSIACYRRRQELVARRYSTFDDLDEDEDEETPALEAGRTEL